MTSPLPDSFIAGGAGAGASSSSPSNSKPRLTLDDITRLFSIPITEAASILGVSTSVLKRLCRKNGIARWPYRQLLSGKTLEDIKKEAEIEKSKIQKNREEMGKRKPDTSKANSTASMGSFKNIGDNHRIAPGQAFQQGNRIISPHLDPFNPIKNIPTYLDEFKLGFPPTGLSSASSNKWWGTEDSSPVESSVKDSSPVESSEQTQCEKLVALRKRAVEESRELLKGEGKNKDLENNRKLNKKQKVVLMQIFGSAFPDQWKDNDVS